MTNVFGMACVRRILGVTQRNRLHSHDIKKHLHLQKEVNYRIQHWHLRYVGHVMTMNEGRYLKIALSGGVHRIRQRGRPPKNAG